MDKKYSLPQKSSYMLKFEDVALAMFVAEKNLANDEMLILHSHYYSELFACVTGEVRIATKSDLIILHPGELAIFPTGLAHKKLKSDLDTQWYSIAFYVSLRSGRYNEKLYNNFAYLCSGTNPHKFSDVENLCDIVRKISIEADKKVKKFNALKFAYLLSELSNALECREVSGNHAIHFDMNTLFTIENVINNYYTEPFTVETMAEMMHISSRQLSRIIKKCYGMSLNKILASRRIEMASRLLIETEESMDKIMEKTGLQSRTDFYNKFKEHFGMTPNQYRTQNRIESGE